MACFGIAEARYTATIGLYVRKHSSNIELTLTTDNQCKHSIKIPN